MSRAGRPRRGVPALVRTLLVAALAPLGVLLMLAAFTADRHSRHLAVSAFDAPQGVHQVAGRGLAFLATPEPTLLRCSAPEGHPPVAAFAFDLIRRTPSPLRLVFLSRLPDGAEPPSERFAALDLSDRLRGAGRQRLQVSLDGPATRMRAPSYALAISTRQGQAGVVIEHAHFVTESVEARVATIARLAFEHRPLDLRSTNLVATPSVAGHGVGLLVWGGLLLALLALVIRRFVLREAFAWGPHAVVTVLALALMGDLRDSTERYRHAAAALGELRDAPDEPAWLARHTRHFPWLAPAVAYLKQHHAEGTSYHLALPAAPNREWANLQLRYYALPHRAVARPADAQVVFVTPDGVPDFSGAWQWRPAGTLPGGLSIFERAR